MRRLVPFVLALVWAFPSSGAEGMVREAMVRHADPAAVTLPDLISPEGRSRWDLTTLPASSNSLVRIAQVDGAVRVTNLGVETSYTGEESVAWVLPESRREDLRMGTRRTLAFRTGAAEFRAEVETIGIGWVHLPAGPREVVLQRARVLRRESGQDGFTPFRVLHRWVDPRDGVVAQAAGPISAAGGSGTALDEIWAVDQITAGAADLTLYVDELQNGVYEQVFYGWDRGLKSQVSELTPDAFATVGDLINANTWNFSQNTVNSSRLLTGTTAANNTTAIVGTGTLFTQELEVGDRISLSPAPTTFAKVTAITDNTHLTVDSPLGNGTTQSLRRRVREVAATVAPINASETCNAARCGFTRPNAYLERRDVRFGDNTVKYNTSAQREDRATDVTIWLRSGSQKEGRTGSFGTGESGFCYDPTFDSTPRSNVPEWRFSHQDTGGWFMQTGDLWEGGPFNCEQNLFNQTCGAPNLFDRAWTKACGTHTGKQTGQVLKGGVVLTPSGHTFNSLLARTVADFCVYIDSLCFIKVDEVRTVVYLWQVPYLGSVARVQSIQNAADLTGWSEVSETDFKFGLFPPVTIQVGSTTDTSVTVSWNPGNDTRRIKDYRVYWDTDSGGATPYAFNSISNPGQVSFAGTQATISGLTPGTTYYVTVTSRSDFTDPSSSITTTYESMLYPTQVSGDPTSVYPVEVMAATTGGSCIPTTEVQGVTVSETSGVVEICWQPVTDPCLVGYDVVGAVTPESDANFSTVGQTGIQSCWTGTPTQSYFLVVARGSGGSGPWGHYGR